MKKCTHKPTKRTRTGRTLNLAKLLNYQKNAIVSLEVLRKPTGTVTMFAFDKDQGLSEHTAPFDALVQVVDGQAEITISRKAHRVCTGELIIMPAHKPHAVAAVTPFKMMLVMIRS